MNLEERLARYVRDANARRESGVLARLRAATAELPEARMQISVEQGRLMALLCELSGARKAIEIGTFTGYSALCVAERLPPDGRLVACDVSEEWTAVARRFWREAGVDGKIDLRIGPARDTLRALVRDGEAGTFQFAFIDADKAAYRDYYEGCLELLGEGGLLVIDNMFLAGRVLDPRDDDEAARVVRDLTRDAFEDPRVEPVLIPIRDGVLVARRR